MTVDVVIIKRNGEKESFSINKIKEVIDWACEGLNVNPLELESKIETMFHTDSIKTVDIHNNIIHHAQTLARPDVPDWVKVAGRLNTMKRWKDTLAYEIEFKAFVKDMIRRGKYNHPNILKYTDEQLDYLDDYIIQKNDLDHSYGSTLTAENKYLMEEECIQQMFMVTAMIIFQDKDLSSVVELYNALSERKISLATPWLSNLRSNGNISSCFIMSIGDNSDSIGEAIKKAINISRMGGGLGIYLGNLRAKGSSINGRDNSAKSVNLAAKVFNDIALWFDQGGKRAGAFTIALPVWHNDIEEFLEIQGEVGDQRTKAHDIFPQVCIPDLFMKIDKQNSNRDWYTFCPKECLDNGIKLNGVYGEEWQQEYSKAVELAKEGVLKVFTKHDTRTILKSIMRTQFDSGLPYISFTDTMNKFNPNSHVGGIVSANLCTESYSTTIEDLYTHTCNLASIVAGRMESENDFIEYSKLLCEVLDAGIDLTKSPDHTSMNHNSMFRTIGIGIQGAMDWMVKNNKNYRHVEEFTKIAELIEYGAVVKSIELARDKEPFLAFKGSKWETGELVDNFLNNSVTNLDWSEVQDLIDNYGIRNSQLTSPAPNTSTSVFMDAAAGVLPVYSPFFREDNDNGKYPVACMFLEDYPLGYSQSFRTYDQTIVAKALAGMQKFVDTGISGEYLLDHNKPDFSAKDLYDLIHCCWDEGLKTIYYIRHIKKGETVEDLLGIKEEACVGCAG